MEDISKDQSDALGLKNIPDTWLIIGKDCYYTDSTQEIQRIIERAEIRGKVTQEIGLFAIFLNDFFIITTSLIRSTTLFSSRSVKFDPEGRHSPFSNNRSLTPLP